MLHWSVTGGWKEGSHSTWNCPASQSTLDCLDVYVLETAYYQYRSQYGELRSKSFYLLHQFIQQLTIILFMNGSDFLFIIRLVVFQTFSWFTGGTDTQPTICSVELVIPRTQGSSPSTLVLWQKYEFFYLWGVSRNQRSRVVVVMNLMKEHLEHETFIHLIQV